MSVLLIVIKLVCCLAFLAAGAAKLARYPLFAEQFKAFGLPVEMMIFIGVLELAGAVGFWVPGLTLWAFSGLACLMAGAMFRHARARHSFMQLMPSVILFFFCLVGVLLSWS